MKVETFGEACRGARISCHEAGPAGARGVPPPPRPPRAGPRASATGHRATAVECTHTEIELKNNLASTDR